MRASCGANSPQRLRRAERLAAVLGEVEGRVDGAIDRVDELTGEQGRAMSMVDITFNGRKHQVQCGDGEEPRLRRLAAYVDSCASKLLQQHGQIADAKVLLLTSLLIADELSDAYEEIKRLKAQAADQERRAEEEAAQALDRVTSAAGTACRRPGECLAYRRRLLLGSCPVGIIAPGLVRSNGSCP